MSPDWRAAYRDRRIVVTGATGFIGWHLATALREAGADVLAVARPSGDRSTEASALPGVTVLADLATAGSAAALISEYRPAVTFNLAGYGVDPSERDVPLAERLNTELPAELAHASAQWPDRDWPGQHLVHAGSALEYGTAGGDLAEDTAPQPTTLYGTTKEAGTRAVLARAGATGGRATVARLFTVYGPREHPGRLLPTLVRAAGADGPISLSAGTQRRDFTWVGDVVEGLLRLGTLGNAGIGIVNLATGRLVTVREFVERAATVLRITPGRLRFGAIATRPEEMVHGDVAIARLEALTGWRPTTSIETGVRLTAAAEP